MLYVVTLLALAQAACVPCAVRDPILATRFAYPATRTSYRESSHFNYHRSRGITGSTTTKQKIAAAFHHDFLDAFDD